MVVFFALLVLLVVLAVVAPQPLPRFSRSAALGSRVEASLALAPVTLAVATVVTCAETEAARDELSTLNVLVGLATAVSGGHVTEGEGALSTAAKSSCCGAGAAAARRAMAAATRILDQVML